MPSSMTKSDPPGWILVQMQYQRPKINLMRKPIFFIWSLTVENQVFAENQVFDVWSEHGIRPKA